MNESDLLELVKVGFFKIGETTYVLEGRDWPHDERCEDSMCWCATRAKRDEPEKWKKYVEERNARNTKTE